MSEKDTVESKLEEAEALIKEAEEEHRHMSKAKKLRKRVFNPMGRIEDIDEDEILIADIRRHPIGLFLLYLYTILAIGLSFIIIFAFLPSVADVFSVNSSGASLAVVFFAMIVSLFAVVFLIIATKIYNANQLIVTSDNVTQVHQKGLFHRKVSEVSMENIEDVSAHQEGVLSTLFNYGRIHIETAGEQDNYNFKFCGRPNACAKAIQDARTEFVKRKHTIDSDP